jgi:hypothetical protein
LTVVTTEDGASVTETIRYNPDTGTRLDMGNKGINLKK